MSIYGLAELATLIDYAATAGEVGAASNPLVMAMAGAAGLFEIAVESSAIRSLTYAPNWLVLPEVMGTVTVNFHDGTSVDYEDVLLPSFVGFLHAPSVGAYYNQYVREQWG